MLNPPTRTRWHGRAAFLATTLLAVSALGGPFLVTRGLIAHGALFLPVVLGLLFFLGAPIVRLALASGQMDHRLAGREALQPLALLIRLVLAAVLFGVGARACAWMADRLWLNPTAGPPGYQTRELSVAASQWTMSGEPYLWGLGLMLLVIGALAITARRKRLAGLGWIGGWLLWLIVGLFVLGLLAGYALPGAGGLAALVASPRLGPLLGAEFWSDAIACALLAIGAQAGLLTAGGAGLPQRAQVGRESRILVASIGVVMVTAGLTGLVLLCALCAKQGIVPTPDHAVADLLILELVPALGRDLFPGWPPEYTPSPRQVTLAWLFIVALGAGFGVAALLTSRRWLSHNWRSPAAKAGYLATGVVIACVAADYWRGVPDAAEPITKVLPALLALLHLTLARRAGPGMRVVSAAFGSGRPWVERLNVILALRIARLLLLVAVPVLAVAHRPHSLALAGMAIGVAVVWIGSLHTTPRARGTGVYRAIAAALVMIAIAPVAHALARDAETLQITEERDAARRMKLRAQAEEWAARMHANPDAPSQQQLRAALIARLEPAPNATPAGPDRDLALDQSRDGLAVALLLFPDDPEFQRLERLQLAADGVRPVRLDEAISEHSAGRPAALREQALEISRNLPARELRRLLDASGEPRTVEWTLALVTDLQAAYGSAPPLVRDFRQYELRRALAGRSLLRPDPAVAGVLLTCLGLVAVALAIALTLGLAPRPLADR